MTTDHPTILATSGGYRPGHRTWFEFDALVHHAVELSGAHGRRPRVTFLGTAAGDPEAFSFRALEAGRVAGFDRSDAVPYGPALVLGTLGALLVVT